MANKITKRDRYNTLLTFAEVQADEGMVAFIKNELDLLNRKHPSGSKPTAKQNRNMEIQRAIVGLLKSQPNRLFTLNELETADFIKPEDEMSNQRISSLVRQLLSEYGKGNTGTGEVKRITDKRKVYFQYNGNAEGD